MEGRRHGREVDDRLDAGERLRAAHRLQRLPVVGQVSRQKRRLDRLRRVGRDAVDVEHFVAVFEQIADHGPTDFAAASCHDDLHLSSALYPRARPRHDRLQE